MDDLQIKEGLTDKQIRQLIEFTSTDEAVQKFTSDPKRFKDFKTAKNWVKKPTLKVYALVNTKGNLAGIAWAEEKPWNSYPTTTGIRVYEDYRGKGVAASFYKEILGKIQGEVWVMISADNLASIRLHEKLGFIRVTDPDENGKIFMIKE